MRMRKGDKSFMRRYPKMFLFAVLASAGALYSSTAIAHAKAAFQASDTAEQEQSSPEYEIEYNEYTNATKEPDLEKRATMLIEFIEKHPKSTLRTYAEGAYANMLLECSNEKKYKELESLAQKWLKLHPDDLQTIAYIARASESLGQSEQYVQSLQDIYRLKPTGDIAISIAQAYLKMNNMPKYLEWVQTIFKYPEYDANFALRFDLVQYYVKENDFAKAAEYAALTLKSADFVQQPSAETQKQLRSVRHICYDIIGRSLYEKEKYAEAIKAFRQAIKEEKYGAGYYYIGLCQRNLEQIDEAMVSLAMAEQQGGEVAPKAKEYLEQLYKALHNNTTIGIEKIYRKAKEQTESAGEPKSNINPQNPAATEMAEHANK
jgi:tetratricopeptide (TPR) repeat protein